MATRSIVTSQPDVACDVCGRRLLRGEQPESFLAGAEQRLVCELCAPRATQEGWLRAAQVAEPLALRRPSRRARGMSLLDRLRQLREPARRVGAGSEPVPEDSHDALGGLDLSDVALERLMGEGTEVSEGSSQSPLGSQAMRARAAPVPARAPQRERPPLSGASGAMRALEVFNAGEHPRRVGGVARSLGQPAVSVRELEDTDGRQFAIVVAWELCWYRYVVDLDDEEAGALLEGEGMELSDLPAQDREANAQADERGALLLLG
jgi:hypothetical protein